MAGLFLDSLEVRGFRAFRHLQIEHLGRVNLIVGKNNVGKSCLLEALHLYARRGAPELIWSILENHNESWQIPSRRLADEDTKNLLSTLKYLFYGRGEVTTGLEPIQIGPVNSLESTLSITIGWYTERPDEDGNLKLQILQPEEYDTAENPIPRFTIQLGTLPKSSYRLRNTRSISPGLLRPELKEMNSMFITANGLNGRQIGELWDSIALTSLEKDVLASLQIIAPGAEGISLITALSPRREIERPSTSERLPIIKIADIADPLPLRSLGDGMQRVLGIALALVNAKDGLLLIDEIENGIHYSAQSDLWRFIFEVASRLNVQVFATTHSWDCIEAFQKVARQNKAEGLLVRLSSKHNDIAVTLFDEEELGIATREQIEVR